MAPGAESNAALPGDAFAGKIALVLGVAPEAETPLVGGRERPFNAYGRLIARALAAQGARVFVIDPFAAAAASLIAEICQTGGEAAAWAVDMTDAPQPVAMTGGLQMVYGAFDLAFFDGAAILPTARLTQAAADRQSLERLVRLALEQIAAEVLPTAAKGKSAAFVALSIAIDPLLGPRAAPRYAPSPSALEQTLKMITKNFPPHHLRANAALPPRVRSTRPRDRYCRNGGPRAQSRERCRARDRRRNLACRGRDSGAGWRAPLSRARRSDDLVHDRVRKARPLFGVAL